LSEQIKVEGVQTMSRATNSQGQYVVDLDEASAIEAAQRHAFPTPERDALDEHLRGGEALSDLALARLREQGREDDELAYLAEIALIESESGLSYYDSR
jgi:hypothetical protein